MKLKPLQVTPMPGVDRCNTAVALRQASMDAERPTVSALDGAKGGRSAWSSVASVNAERCLVYP